MSFKDLIVKEKLPKHVAVIMDGNGRWAKKRGNQRIFGHKNAITAVRETVETAGELGIDYLTLYAFSTENWNRPKPEVDGLMALLINSIKKETPNLMQNNVRMLHIGDSSRLPDNVNKNISELIKKTENNTGLSVILALNYSARWEITQAIKNISSDFKLEKFNSDEINETLISNYLTTSKIPDPELIIRTSGEHRISNFLLWQIAYSEFYFTDILWPDFRKEDFFEAVHNFQQRERRFGKTEDQIKI